MNDQVNTLNNKTVDEGLPVACFLGSGQTDGTMEERVFRGEFKIVFVTPEKITYISEGEEPGTTPKFIERLKRLRDENKIGLIAINETHCISQWGHDFRVSYVELSKISEHLGSNIPSMALTATAVKHVREDITKILQLRNPYIATNSIDWPNLRIQCHRKQDFGKDLDLIVSQVSDRNATMTYDKMRKKERCRLLFRHRNSNLQSYIVPRSTKSWNSPKHCSTGWAVKTLRCITGKCRTMNVTVLTCAFCPRHAKLLSRLLLLVWE